MNYHLRTSEAGQLHIKDFERCVLKAYPDPLTGGMPWTIGWGSTGPGIRDGIVWTQEQADARFITDLRAREDIVKKYVKVPLTQGQFDALVSIVYNVGIGSTKRDGIIFLKNGQPSTLLRKLNEGNYAGARAELMRWVSPGSTVEKGLRRRRAAEEVLWDTV